MFSYRAGSSRVRLCAKCRMGIRPPKGENDWCREVCDALDRLKGKLNAHLNRNHNHKSK